MFCFGISGDLALNVSFKLSLERKNKELTKGLLVSVEN